MTYEVTLPGDVFVPFVKAALDVVNDAKVIISDDIVISSVDTANVALVDSSMVNPSPPATDIDVIVDLRSIAGITSAKKDVVLRIDDDKHVTIRTGRMTYTMPNIIEPRIKERKIPQIDYPVRIDLSTEAFAEGIMGMLSSDKVIEEIDSIWFIAEEGSFIIKDKMQIYSTAEFTEDEYTYVKFDGPQKVLISLEYLKNMYKHLKMFDRVEIVMMTDKPLVMKSLGEERKLAYAIAYRIP